MRDHTPQPSSADGGAHLRARLSTLAAICVSCFALLLSPGAALALQPGELDPTFGASGSVFHQFGTGASAASQVNALAVQPDGKLVLGGFATDKNGKHAFLVARLDQNGLVDPSFGDAGRVVVQLGTGSSPSSEVNALALQPDGKIVTAGGALLTRLNPNGSFDSSFGDDGKLLVTVGGPDSAIEPLLYAVAVQRDGKIVAAGTGVYTTSNHANDWALVVRVSGNDGSPDPSFGDGGEVFAWINGGGSGPWHTELHALALQPDGKLLLGGFTDQSFGGPSSVVVARLKAADGGFDSSFADGGVALHLPFPDESVGAVALALALQPDGGVVAAGTAVGNRHPGWRALVDRFGGDGRFDDAFADHGSLVTQLGAGGDSASTQTNALALQPDGRIVLAGTATDSRLNSQLLVARLNGPDGSFDPAFGSGGRLLHQFGSGDAGVSEAHALALQPDGKILTAGSADGEALVARLIGQPPAPPLTPPEPSAPPVTPAVPPPVAIAALSKLTLSPVAFAAADSGGSISRRTGTTITYHDTQPATTTFTVLKLVRGIRSGGRCLKPKRGQHGRSCTRHVPVGSFRHRDEAGQNSFHFTGRVHHHKLAPGRYRLQAIPRLAGRIGHKVTTHFRIIP